MTLIVTNENNRITKDNILPLGDKKFAEIIRLYAFLFEAKSELNEEYKKSQQEHDNP